MGRKTKTVLIAATAAVLVGLIVIAMILLRPRDDAVFDTHVEKITQDADVQQTEEAMESGTGVMEESPEVVSAPESTTAEDEEKAQELYESIISKPLTVTISTDNGITETISTDTLTSWVSVSDTQVNIDASQVASYVQGIADQYNSWGKQISFTTTGGSTISLGAVDYGWKLNQDVTAADIQAAVLSGNGGTVPVTWSSKETVMGTNGVGNTYIEADLDAQHVYVYKGGSLIMDTDVVSGRALKNWGTPNGVFEIVGMQRDATLKGENYSTPVKYWMPFYLGWGFHDANWRSVFGGDQYVANGSHGCINLPPSFASELFNTIYVGMPVVVYGGMSQSEAQTYIAEKSSSTEDKKEETTADASSDASSAGSSDGSSESAGDENGEDSADIANTSDSDAATLADARAIAAAVGLGTDDQQAQIIAQAIANYEAVGMTRDQAKAQVQADLQQQASAQQAAAASNADTQSAAAGGSTSTDAPAQQDSQTQAGTGTSTGTDASQNAGGASQNTAGSSQNAESASQNAAGTSQP